MKISVSRRSRIIIATAITLYAVALAVVWLVGTAKAKKRMTDILLSAERGYAAVIDGEIEAALRNAGGAIINFFNGRCEPQPIERMQDLAKAFNLDEVNFVGLNGKVIASNIKSVLGFDFNETPQTREFLTLTNDASTLVSQPFRYGVANPDMFCKYYGMAFPNRSGVLQLGISLENLRQNMYSYTEAEADRILKEWRFSVAGWYARGDSDANFSPGKFFRCWNDEHGMLAGLCFTFANYRYKALLPESYCYGQRNVMFISTALALGMLVALFTAILVLLTKTSAKLELMHAAANARTAADLAMAKTIQFSVLPTVEGAFMDYLGFSLSAAMTPAREVGGDFYDFYPIPGGRIAFLIADVSGKGIPAAMFMMEAKNIIKACLIEFLDLAEAVQNANARLCATNRAEMFVTCWIGALDPKTGTFTYVNAGHNWPFIRRADGTIERVDGKGGLFLGMFEKATYRVNALKLDRNDVLYLYTDGITEAMNEKREIFGEGRLRAAFSGFNGDVASAVRRFVGAAEQSDDMTELIFRWNGEPVRSEREFACLEGELSSAVEFIRSALVGLPAKVSAAILNAADEITSNIVNYSGSPDFRIEVERTFDRLRVRFSDSGKAYDPLTHVDPDTHATIEERPIGGLGLVMVKRLVDRVSYMRENGRNVLTLTKRIG